MLEESCEGCWRTESVAWEAVRSMPIGRDVVTELERLCLMEIAAFDVAKRESVKAVGTRKGFISNKIYVV